MSGRYNLRDPLSIVHPRSLKHLHYQLNALVEGRLWLKILLGMFLGIISGLVLGPSAGLIDPQTSYVIGEWLALPGYIFLALLQMIVVPLVVASIILGIAAGEDMEQLKKVGLRTVAYFLVTTAIAIMIGLGLAMTIDPGTYISTDTVQQTMGSETVQVAEETFSTPEVADVPGMISTILPTNPLGALATGQMLQVVIFSIIIGVALISMAPKQSRPLLELLGSLQEVSMTVVRWSMLLAPIAVFGLICKFTINLGVDALLGMLVYVGTVLLGLLMLLLFYMLIVATVARKNPISFLQSSRDVLLLAFSTSSSAAVMPLSIKTAEEKLGVRSSISQFVVPLGATINMNGTALYQSIAAVFLAQVFGVDLGFGALLLLMVTVVGASIGTPSTPGVGIVILAMILSTVGVPTAGIALIIGVDRILDMSRTAVNVTGDIVTCVVMDKWVDGKETAFEEPSEFKKHEMPGPSIGENGSVEVIQGDDPVGTLRAIETIKAIGRGFNPEKTIPMLDDDLLMLEVIDLSKYASTNKEMTRLKGRIIGKGGKTREIAENLIGVKISIYGKTVSFIGYPEQIQIMRTAIEMLIEGANHGPVYSFLEKKHKELMQAQLDSY